MLTRTGRLKPDGTLGPDHQHAQAGLRVAGYDDPFERQLGQDFTDRYDDTPDAAQQDAFLHWLQPLIGKVDVVMVHEPALIQTALDVLQRRPAGEPARVHGRPHAQGRPRRPSRA